MSLQARIEEDVASNGSMKMTVVPTAGVQTLRKSGHFTCIGLGSCVVICALDPGTGVAGVAHVMLPSSLQDREVDKPGRYADTAVPALLDMMEQMGASRSRVVAAVIGGAAMYATSGNTAALDLGQRNVSSVHEQLRKHGVRCLAEEVGGNLARTLLFSPATGEVRIKNGPQPEHTLSLLRR
jgi:chemotaxis protein CheD